MSNNISVKTNFTAGQVSPLIYGRGDLGIFENGARTLENVIIHPTGGISRRRGLRYIDKLSGAARLLPFEFNTEQTYLLCFMNKKLRIYRDNQFISELDTPWSLEQLDTINWTQSADTLLVVHPDVAPKQISRYDGDVWKVEDWEYYTEDGKVYCPYYNFFQHKENLKPSGTGGEISLTADNDIFSADYVGSRIRINEGEVEVTSFVSTRELKAKVSKNLSNANITTDWEESSFSVRRGWPNSVTFHQDRMVIGGSRSLPNRLWLSKSSDLFNFDLGEGLDDESIEFAILSDQVNAIKSVVSARHLLVFTTGAEWMVTGQPLTPESIQLTRQTKVGIYSVRNVPPQNVDGATLFVSSSGRQIREFLFADVEQAYQAKDLTLLASEIIKNPRDCTFHPDDNVLYVVLEDGSVSCLTTYRTEQVTAWSKLKTDGNFRSVAAIGDDIYFCIQRDNGWFIEKMEDDWWVDCSLKLTAKTPQTHWEGLEIFNGKEVSVVADDFTIGLFQIEDAELNLEEAASEIIVGFPYEHIIEPLPYMQESSRPWPPKALRVIQGLFRIISSRSFRINIGGGYFEVPLKKMYRDQILDAPANTYNGDVELRSLGWVKDMERPIWSIRSSVPVPFTLLSAVLEVKVKS